MAAPAPARITYEGADAVRLEGNGRSIALPAQVPAGDYQIVATFGSRPAAPHGTIHVADGSAAHIICNGRMFTCSAH